MKWLLAHTITGEYYFESLSQFRKYLFFILSNVLEWMIDRCKTVAFCGVLLLEQFAIICNILEMVLENDTNFTTINLKNDSNIIFDSFYIWFTDKIFIEFLYFVNIFFKFRLCEDNINITIIKLYNSHNNIHTISLI